MKTSRTETHGQDASRPQTIRERARAARHAAYVIAKERKKTDPRTLELKEKLKLARREANAQAKERRKTDPKEIALKAKLKADRKEANRRAKEQRKMRAGETTKAERASKYARLHTSLAPANTLAMPHAVVDTEPSESEPTGGDDRS
jgi:hypothetical protein